MRLARTTSLAFAVTTAVFAQSTPTRPEFEVASIKHSPPSPIDQASAGVHIDGAQVHVNYLPLKDYIRIAYKVKDFQVSGPEWLGSERFDLDAKLPDDAPRDQVPEMLQSLLEDRFRLKLHRDSKEFSVYALVVGSGGSKLKQSPAEANPADAAKAPVDVAAHGGQGGVNISLGRGSYFSFANNRMEGTKLAMTPFADLLARFADRPVIDQTGLTGAYDFTLDLTPEDFRNMLIRSAINAGVTLPAEARRLLEGTTEDSLLVAIRGLGLKLDPRKAPLEVLVIDSIQKTPTAN